MWERKSFFPLTSLSCHPISWFVWSLATKCLERHFFIKKKRREKDEMKQLLMSALQPYIYSNTSKTRNLKDVCFQESFHLKCLYVIFFMYHLIYAKLTYRFLNTKKRTILHQKMKKTLIYIFSDVINSRGKN